MKAALALIVFSLTFHCSKCAKILGVFPVPTGSHYNLGSTLLKALAERGHDVTIISPFTEKIPPTNGSYREIVLTGITERNQINSKKTKLFDMEETSPFIVTLFIMQFSYEITEFTLSHQNVQNLLNSDETFDAVIVVQFMNMAHSGFASHFNAPLILLSTIGANSMINHAVGNPSPLSYIPQPTLGYSSRMTFWERTVNTLLSICGQAFGNFYIYPKHKHLFDKYFPSGPDFYDVIYNASLVLLNSHPSTNQAVPYVPNMIDVGGYHVQPAKALPADLQKYLDEANEGVIYFSLGSIVQSSDLPAEKLESFLKAFSKLKQKVLWKWEKDVLPGQPSNVRVGKWMPQQEILAHPNVRLFITHGGLLSTTETIYHGVPVLAIPIAADQKLNALRVVNEGLGLLLYFKDITESSLTEKLQELLENPKYSRNAKKRSELFHDRPVKPLDTAVYWVEYVIRHGGAPHLKVAGVDLPFYKYMLLDVGAFIVLVASLAAYLSFKVLCKIVRSYCSRSKAKKEKRN